MADGDEQAGRKRSRSPGYPNFGLPEAIRKAAALYKNDKRNPVPLTVAAQHWGYSPTSSAVLLSAATLKKFGLIEEVGGGSARLIKLTDLALNIILADDGSDEKAEALRTAAMKPALHVELWTQFGEELPSDANLKRILIMEKGFGDAAANDVIREYKETISFAAVKSEGKMDEDMVRPAANSPDRAAQFGSNNPLSSPGTSSEKSRNLREYRFPLIEAEDAVLRLAAPMSEENFALLREQLDAFLTVTKRALVATERIQQTQEEK